MVAAARDKNPALKLEIDGYTDGVGAAAHNLDLSRRRAEAVKAVLVSQLGCDPGQLTTAGFGAARPIASNDTPRERADNRRVEFVRQ
jgi:OmpA-OmpF porin, OOP family